MKISEGAVVDLCSGKWTVVRFIGRGAFGEVYEAIDQHGQRGALKFVRKAPGAERELLLAPETTGKSNVLPMLESGEYGDGWVIAMPLAESDLQSHIDNETKVLPYTEALNILIDIARALVEIDGRIVHRDLKPSNIVLWKDSWHITDFGISRYADAATATETWRDARSAPYAAPEQWRLEHAESRTDIYSFGIIAYELLAGRRPFVGPLVEDYKVQHLLNAPEPIPGQEVDPRLSNLVAWCLTKVPTSRPSAEMVLMELSKLQSGRKVEGLEVLIQANKSVIRERTEREAQAELERMNKETREQRHLDSIRILESVVTTLWITVNDAAPAITVPLDIDRLSGQGDLLLVHEEKVKVAVSPIKRVRQEEWGRFPPAFDVVAMSGISIRLPTGGKQPVRTSSYYTWMYCDAEKDGHYRWYEMSFRTRGSIVHYQSWSDPLQVDIATAGVCLEDGRGLGSAFVPIDTANEADFARAWAQRVGEAFQGNLPEIARLSRRVILNSYRR